MSEVGTEVEADDGAVQAAHREYQHQRERILQYLIDCGAVTEDKAAGGELTSEDHYGFEVDTLTILDATRAFLTVSDARMCEGSANEKIALAVLLAQYGRLLPISPLTAMLAEVAGRAVQAGKSQQGQNGAETNKATARANAVKVAGISAKAARNPDGTLASPSATGRLMAKKLGKDKLDPKTVKAYDDINMRKVVVLPCGGRG